MKRRVAQAVPLPPATLLLNPAVMEEITAAKTAGREVWLASAADELVVAPLVEEVGATGCFASDGYTNLVPQKKAAVLVERFGRGGFGYIGNKRSDLVVWQQARQALGVNLSASLARKLQTIDNDARFLGRPGVHLLDYLQALRPHHWVKNVLVFAPLSAAHEARPEYYLVTGALFIALSACASGTYLLNDLLDLPHDRRHENKRHRPLAAGKAPLLSAVGISAALVTAGLTLAFCLSRVAGFCVLLYVCVTFAYSLSLKQKTFLDVITPAMLYTIRVIAGGAVTSITLSPWFLGFFFFVFLFLAIIKRKSELYALRELDVPKASGRACFTEDLEALMALSAASSFASVVILALYIHSLEVNGNYAQPEWLWLICLLLVYWLGRLTLLVNRGIVNDDPVVFALGDRVSWLTAVGILTLFTAAL